MRILTIVVGCLAALMLSGCLELKEKLVLNADGSGELHLDYTLSPDALAQIQSLRLPPVDSVATPILQPFPINEAELRQLAGSDAELKSVTVVTTANGGRQIKAVFSFASVRKFARSEAAALCRIRMTATQDNDVLLQLKTLGMDYADWKLPRRDQTELEQRFAVLKLGAKDLKYRLDVVVPGVVKGGNAATTEGATAGWTYTGADLKLEQLIGTDKRFVVPAVQFTPKDLKVKLPVDARFGRNLRLVDPEQVKLRLTGMSIKQVLNVKPGENEANEQATFRHNQVRLAMRLTCPEGMTPVAYEMPQMTELITGAGKNLVVPMPPVFGYRRQVPRMRGRNTSREFAVYVMFATAEQTQQFSLVRGSFVFHYAGGTEEKELPPAAEWPNGALAIKTPAGREAEISIPEDGKLRIAHDPDAALEVGALFITRADGRMAPIRRVSRSVHTPKDPKDRKTAVTVVEGDIDKTSKIKVTYYKNLQRELVPFRIENLDRGKAMPEVTIEDLSGRSLRLLATIAAHSQDVRAVAVAPNGVVVASGGLDGKIVLSAIGKQTSKTFNAHANGVNDVAFTPDGKTLVSVGQDKVVRVWNVADARELAALTGSKSSVRAVDVTPDGRFAVTGALDNLVRIWDLEQKKQVRTLERHTRGIRTIDVAKDGKQILSGGLDRKMILWDFATGKPLHTLTGHKFSVRGLQISPNGKLAASGADDMTVRLWDLATGKEIREYKGHTNLVSGVCFLADNKRFAAADMEGSIRIWDVASEEQLAAYKGKGVSILCLAVDAGGVLAAGTRDGKILVLQLPVVEEE